MMKEILFPLLMLGVLTLNGLSREREACQSGCPKTASPTVNKQIVNSAPRNAPRQRSPERHLRRIISRMTRKHPHK